MHKFIIALFVSFTLLVSSCDSLERDIDLNLPQPERLLVVECYLEPGQPYRVLLTETKGYFEDLNACPIVKGATVIIRHNGIADTLTEAIYFSQDCPADSLFGFIPFFNADYTRFYNYGSNNLCTYDFNDYELEVIDHQGNRRAIATTKFLSPIQDIEMTPLYRDTMAGVIISVPDDATTTDYYRLMLHKNKLYKPFGAFNVCKNPRVDITIDDARFFNNGYVAFGTGYDFDIGDTLITTAYHIDKSYHDYLETISDAENSNGSPFAQPGRILTNIVGGQGVFTTLNYRRDTLIIP